MPNRSVIDVAKELTSFFFQHGKFRGDGSAFTPASTSTFSPSSLPENSPNLNVIGIGVAEKSSDSEIFVYVKSAPAAYTKKAYPVCGYKTSFKKIGKTEIKPEAASSYNNSGNCFSQNSKVACGSSCSPSSQGIAGTFGAILKHRQNHDHFALSNNHVFASCNHEEHGMPILSPATLDVTPSSPIPQALFKHHAILELRSGNPAMVPPNSGDAAIAKVLDLAKISSQQGFFYDTPTQTAPPTIGLRVKKVGRTTGLTTGVIESEMHVFQLPYKSKNFSGLAYFNKVWIIRPENDSMFAAQGDSGSLVVTEDGSRTIGLLFAASGSGYGVISPIKPILDLFDMDLVSQL